MRGSFESHALDSFEIAPLNQHPLTCNSRARTVAGTVLLTTSLLLVAALLLVLLLTGQHEIKEHHRFHSQELLCIGRSQLLNSICRHVAMYADVCERELTSFNFDPSAATPLGIVTYAVQATANRANEAHSLAINCSYKQGLSRLEGQCANDCVELLNGVNDNIKLAAERLSGLSGLTDVESLRAALMDVKVWLSSSLSYQIACSDNFQVAPGNIQQQIQSNEAYLSEVIGFTLNLVDILSQAGNDLTPWLGALPPTPPFIGGSGRRLLSISSEDHTSFDRILENGFPFWVSAAERRLLQDSTSSIALSANVTVASDGSGQYVNISAALDAIPNSYSGRYVIYIKKGVYEEVFNVTKSQTDLTFVGDGIGETIITGDRNVASGDFNTYRTSTVGIGGSGFYARDITFRNTAGPSGHQAVAVRAGADFLVFYRCSFEGYQDTLYALSSRQFYRDCEISGTIDFIFGNAIAIFQNCVLKARLPMQGQQNTYTAQGRKLASDISGYSFQNCTVTGDANLASANYTVLSYLGRPWKAYSRVVFMQSDLEGLVEHAGWLPWNSSNPFQDTLYYGEYGNRGAGADTSQRVNWTGVHANMSQTEAAQFTVTNFIAGESWIGSLDVTYKNSL